MLRVSVCLWCLAVVALLLMCVTSFPLPSPPSPLPLPSSTSSSSSFSSSYSSSSSSVPMVPKLHRIRSQTRERRGVVKRSNRLFGSFYRLMQRHSRYLDEQAFVEKTFRLFDMNSDNLIERDEFRAIMQLLGLISHSY